MWLGNLSINYSADELGRLLFGGPAATFSYRRPFKAKRRLALAHASQADPHEVNNLADSEDHRETLDELRSLLDEWITDTNDKGLAHPKSSNDAAMKNNIRTASDQAELPDSTLVAIRDGFDGRVAEMFNEQKPFAAGAPSSYCSQSHAWHIYESENHHSQSFCTRWHLAKLAKDRLGFKNRAYDDGRTASEHLRSWNDNINGTEKHCQEPLRKGS